VIPSARPLAIAHRAANHLDKLREAADLGADLVECDVWLYRGRLEVRHLKTLGPIPILWDRWKLVSARAPRLELPPVLDALSGPAGVMLDLKGMDRRMPDELVRALEDYGRDRPLVACARNWHLLEPLEEQPHISVLYSVGSAWQLARLRRRIANGRRHDVSVHRRLLSPEVVEELKGSADTLVTWPVNDDETLDRVLGWGVDGVITDSFDVLRRVVAERADAARQSTGR
jgi:glycerophosphoryl diester phosphodiesterase